MDPPVRPLSVLFARGVIARLAIWPALRIAVEENWGGPDAAQKRTWLASVIVDAFEEQGPTPDDIYIEETLLQVMADEFEVVLEDSSAESVAKDVVRLWKDVHDGKQELVRRFEELAEKSKGKKTIVEEKVVDGAEWEEEEKDDDDGDGDSSEDGTPMLVDQLARERPEVDEDGFTMVKGKGRQHK
jgi:pre-rRNA-processing protein TSR2